MPDVPVASRGRGRRLVRLAVPAVLAGNLVALWLARGPYVNGWDLFGATFGVLALNRDGVGRLVEAVLRQSRRPVFTGGESLISGLVPGLLNEAVPWLLWSHLLNLALFVALSVWVVGQLRLSPAAYWAGVAASPALTELSIIGLRDLPSTAIPYGLATGWVLSDRQRGRHPARLTIVADDEVAALANGLVLLESRGVTAARQYDVPLLLPPGPTDLRIVYRKYTDADVEMSFWLRDAEGRDVPIRCDDGPP